ncbi:hypothetical protein [Microbulbifer spongiae]|uniref:DUF3325 domain-containing protein n=1 Tax=Microbulbifer spongiae TaxID=2944933 RepID=A0ABY9EEW2_9GAMM|nr:hypothetical protein [Microbulbifer sp. MI-G]WKD51192.1 hypothetical protein M8T91_07195 [Microbulbifer sp. MI-G]
MPNTIYTIAGLASLSALAGIICLYRAWLHTGVQPVRRWLGWALMGVSAGGWSSVVGVEYGISIATLIVILGVFVVIALNGDWPSGPLRQDKQRATASAAPRATYVIGLRGIARCLVVVILPAVSGVSAGLLFFGVANLVDSSRLIGAGFVAIAVWTLAVVWCCADRKLLRPSAALVLFSAASGLYLLPAA